MSKSYFIATWMQWKTSKSSHIFMNEWLWENKLVPEYDSLWNIDTLQKKIVEIVVTMVRRRLSFMYVQETKLVGGK
jgi:hypothetical protein